MIEQYRRVRGMLESEVSDLITRAPSTKRRRVRRETGDELDIDRMMVNDPQCWESRVRGASKRLVRLGLGAVFSASEGDKRFLTAAGYATAAADVLERLGYSVEIKAVAQIVLPNIGGKLGLFSVIMKNSQQRLDEYATMVAGLPGFSRDHLGGCFEHLLGHTNFEGHIPKLTSEMKEALGVDYVIGHSRITATWDQPPHTIIEGFRGIFEDLGVSLTS